jgi:hypothetical protein
MASLPGRLKVARPVNPLCHRYLQDVMTNQRDSVSDCIPWTLRRPQLHAMGGEWPSLPRTQGNIPTVPLVPRKRAIYRM